MDEVLFYVVGIGLTVIALVLSAIGIARTDFPSSGAALGGLLAGVGALVVVTAFAGVLIARAEQDHKREKLAEHEAAERPADEAEVVEEPGEEAAPEEAPDQGQQLFADNCGSCHTLADAGTEGAVGPNLDELTPSPTVELVLQTIQEGPGAMPADLLEGAEAEAAAEYVAAAAE